MNPRRIRKRTPAILAAAAALACAADIAVAQLVAFPGAEGFGANALGGRGGDVYHVTSLADTNTLGTLRYGVNNAPGTGRTIVFDISGTIDMTTNLTINKPKITIAGQTAPGDGIMLRGWQTSLNADNLIVRYIHFRPGDLHGPVNQASPNFQGDSLNTFNAKNVIIDHVSTAWSIDENCSSTSSDFITIQNSIIAEGLRNAGHDDGNGGVEAHSYGTLLGYTSATYPLRISIHHNLYESNDSRNPRMGDDTQLDFVNNVLYNWGGRCGYSGGAAEGTPKMNYVGNYLVAGPSTTSGHVSEAFFGGSTNTQIYQSGNLIDSDKNATRNGTNTGWAMFTGTYTQMPGPFAYPSPATDTAAAAYDKVLAQAGASMQRDATDARLVSNVVTAGGAIIDSQSQVGGYPTISSVTRPAGWDSDGDGMPDNWESSRGLNPLAADNNSTTLSPGSYTNLEHYLDYLSLIAQWKPDASGSWTSVSNWVGTMPAAIDATARFGPAITAARTVTLSSPRTVGQISFDNPNSYTLAGTSALSMEVISGTASIEVLSGSHSVSAPLALNNNTLVNISPPGSTLTVTNLSLSAASVTKVGAGTLAVNGVRAAGLAVNAGVLRVLSNGQAAGTSKVTNLAVSAGARLDLGDNKLIVTATPVGTWNGSTYTNLTGLIQSGRNGGNWSGGTGIVTSQTLATSTALTGIGIAKGSEVIANSISETAVWAGQAITGTDTLIMYTYGGDATLDGRINIDDYVRIDSGIAAALTGWSNGDFNYDGKVNIDDYTGFIDANMGNQSGTFFTASAADGGPSGVSAIPEPASLSLVALTAAAAAGIRRRRRQS